MALIKKVMTEYGIEADYWKIIRFTIDTEGKEVWFTLGLYRSENIGTKHLDEYVFASPMLCEQQLDFKDDYNNYFRADKGVKYKDFMTACYEYAKDKIEFFKDAVDDEEEIKEKAIAQELKQEKESQVQELLDEIEENESIIEELLDEIESNDKEKENL